MAAVVEHGKRAIKTDRGGGGKKNGHAFPGHFLLAKANLRLGKNHQKPSLPLLLSPFRSIRGGGGKMALRRKQFLPAVLAHDAQSFRNRREI